MCLFKERGLVVQWNFYVKLYCTRAINNKCFRTHHSPPEGVGEALEALVDVLLHQVDEEGGEDEAEKADVDRGYQFLSRENLSLLFLGKCFSSSCGMLLYVRTQQGA